ncbi:MAG: fibronectin type III domain-containing protein, partial [Candidatus Omnitrophota bacterium]
MKTKTTLRKVVGIFIFLAFAMSAAGLFYALAVDGDAPPTLAAFRLSAMSQTVAEGKFKLASASQMGAEGKYQYVPNEIIVKFKSGASPESVLRDVGINTATSERVYSTESATTRLRKDYKLERDSDGWFWFYGKRYKEVKDISQEDLFKEAYKRMGPREQGMYRTYKIVVSKNSDASAALMQLKNNAGVEYAEPNYLYRGSFTPNDTFYNKQWAYPKTQAEAGWDIQRGDANVIVAIIDSGVDYNHEDLAGNIWHDASGNPGKDFVDINLEEYTGLTQLTGEDYTTIDNEPVDFFGHGTHVAGIVAAVANNSKGVAGLAHNCKIMPVRVGFVMKDGADIINFLEEDDTVAAIQYAADNGAKVINMSFAGFAKSNALKEALDYAISRGSLLVAAAGNEAGTAPMYPAAYDGVIAVSATSGDTNEALAYYSQHGSWIDVAAPGGNDQTLSPAWPDNMIASTIPTAGCTDSGCMTAPSGYALAEGTSMAAPYVSGLAALAFSKTTAATPKDITKAIYLGADDKGATGFDETYGFGRVNVLRTLSVDTITSQIAKLIIPSSTSSVSVSLKGTAAASSFSHYTIEVGRGSSPTSWSTTGINLIADGQQEVIETTLGEWDTTTYTDGTYTMRLKVFDDGGNTKEYRASITVYSPFPVHTPGWPKSTFGSAGIASPTLADIDGDGKLEILVSTSQLGSEDASDGMLYAWNLDGTVVPVTSNWPISGRYAASVGNLDGDDDEEVVVTSGTKIFIFNHDGSSYRPASWPKVEALGTNAVPSLADLDGDGTLEIIIGGPGRVHVWYRDGMEKWGALQGKIPDDQFVTTTTAGDIDGDSHPEVLVVTGGGGTETGGTIGKVYAWKANGSAVAGNWPVEVEGSLFPPVIGDVDGDGQPEIVVNAGGGLFVLENNGTIKTGWPKVSPDSTSIKYFAGGLPILADLDNDGSLEIILAGTRPTDETGTLFPSKIWVFKGDGSTFGQWPYELPSSGGWPASTLGSLAADVNSDGDLEVLTLVTKQDTQDTSLYALRSDGRILSGYPKQLHRLESAYLPAVGDLEGNGNIELAVFGTRGGDLSASFYVYDLPGTWKDNQTQWPMFHLNTQHTGTQRSPTIIVAPSNLAATAVSTSQINLTWHDNSSDETGFIVERKTGTTEFAPIATLDANVHAYHNTRLAANTTYYYRVRAFNAKGNSKFSNVVPASTGAVTAPTAPSNLTAAANGSDKIDLAWIDNANNEDGFRLHHSTDGTTFTELTTKPSQSGTGGTVTYQHTGLTAGSTHYYKVLAYNAGGNSNFTNPVGPIITPTDTPAAPGNLSAAANGSDKIDVGWIDNANNEDGFRLHHSTDGTTFTELTTKPSQSGTGGTVTYQHTGLTAGSTHYYKVLAYNANGNSGFTTTAQATTEAGAVPAVPSNLTAAANGLDKIDVAWIDNANNEDGFRLHHSTDGTTFTELVTRPSQSGTGGTVTYQHTGLTAGSTHYYKVLAYNATGSSGFSNTVQATTEAGLLPNAPTNLAAVPDGKNKINLSWTDNATNESGFKVHHSTDGTTFTELVTRPAQSGTGGTVTYAHTGLNPSSTHYYKVLAYNTNGVSDFTGPAQATTPAGDIPLMPSNLTAAANGSTKIDLAWIDNASNESGFRLHHSTDGTNFTLLTSKPAKPSTGGTVTYQHTGLTAGSTHYYKVLAYNSDGESTPTDVVQASTPGNMPSAPTSLQASIVSSTKIRLVWNDNSNNEQGFKVHRSTDGVTFSEIKTVGSNIVTCDDDSLTSSTIYYYKVLAYNASGNSDFSNTVEVNMQPGTPSAPSNLTANVISSTQINLAWQDNSNNELGFKIHRSTDGTTFTLLTTVGVDAITFSNEGLTASTTYYYKVLAYNASGSSSFSNTAQTTTLSGDFPLTPSSLTATANGSDKIDLSWTDNASNEDGFKIHHSTDGTNFSELTSRPSQSGTGGAVTYQHIGLTAGSTHYYKVLAYNTNGNSGFSNTAQATTEAVTTPSAPSNLTALANGSDKIDLSWTDNATNEGGFKVHHSTDGTTFTELATRPAQSGTGGTVTYTHTGLAASSTHYYKVLAYNASGNSNFTTVAQATTEAGAVPTAPSNLTALANGSDKIDLSWTDNATNESGFKVHHSTDGTTFTELVTKPAQSGTGGTVTYQHIGLTAGSTHYYKVLAYNANGNSGFTAVAQATTEAGA